MRSKALNEYIFNGRRDYTRQKTLRLVTSKSCASLYTRGSEKEGTSTYAGAQAGALSSVVLRRRLKDLKEQNNWARQLGLYIDRNTHARRYPNLSGSNDLILGGTK